jgi:hypothetical protein
MTKSPAKDMRAGAAAVTRFMPVLPRILAQLNGTKIRDLDSI